MFNHGIGEGSSFKKCHPLVNIIYYGFVIGITMFTMDPFFLALTLIGAWTYSVILKGSSAIKTNIILTFPVLIITPIVNMFFSHNGETVLFYIRYNRVTLEAMCYGLAAATLICAVILWFTTFNEIMTAEKLVYLFGKSAPVLGLTLSMIFRFIPLLKQRWQEIHMGQMCLGRNSGGNLLRRARQVMKEISILISWSLEASIETSDSMEARGYGLPGRTSFTLFKFSKKDIRALISMGITASMAVIGCAMGKTTIYYYPRIVITQWDGLKIATLICFAALIALPMVLDLIGERKWKLLMSET